MSVRMKRKEARDMEMEAKNTEKSEKKKPQRFRNGETLIKT